MEQQTNTVSAYPWQRVHQTVFDAQGNELATFKNQADAQLAATSPELLAKLTECRAFVHEGIEVYVQTHSNPQTGLIEDPQDLLSIEADQDFLRQIDEVLEDAGRDVLPESTEPTGAFFWVDDAEDATRCESLEQAHHQAKQQIDKDFEPGQIIKYTVTGEVHPIDTLNSFDAEKLGESAWEQLVERTYEHGTHESNAIGEMSIEDQTRLGQLIMRFVKAHAPTLHMAMSEDVSEHQHEAVAFAFEALYV